MRLPFSRISATEFALVDLPSGRTDLDNVTDCIFTVHVTLNVTFSDTHIIFIIVQYYIIYVALINTLKFRSAFEMLSVANIMKIIRTGIRIFQFHLRFPHLKNMCERLKYYSCNRRHIATTSECESVIFLSGNSLSFAGWYIAASRFVKWKLG